MKILKSILLAGTCLAATAAATIVHAQDAASVAPAADHTTVETIVVGARKSLDRARSIKRDSVQFVDAVVASDIGSLPDSNVAESLARVSGVQLGRGVGEGTSIAIRGLGENVTLYNGREIFDSAGRGGSIIDELGGSTYGLFALVPSPLVSRLEVTKLAGANQISGALGGIIDIHTRKPFDKKGLNGAFTMSGVRDDLPGRNGSELFAMVSDTFANDTLGVLVSMSKSKRDISEQGLTTFSGYTSFKYGGIARTGHSDVRTQEIMDDRRKVGGTAVVQWRPNSRLDLMADVLYSREEADRDRYWLGFNPNVGLTNAVFSENNVLLAGTATTTPNSNVSFFDVKNEIWSQALTGSYWLTDRLKISSQVAFGDSVAHTSRNYSRLTLASSAAAPLKFDFRSGSFGAFDFSNFNLTNPAGLTLALYYDDGRKVETDSLQSRIDVDWKVSAGVLESVEAGGRFERMETSVRPHNALLRPNVPASQLSPTYLSIFSDPKFLPGELVGLPRTYLAAKEAAVGSCHAFTAFPTVSQDPACLNPAQSLSSLGQTYDINEDFRNAYLKLNFAAELGFADFKGNAGVRLVDRRLESIGNVLSGTTATPTAFKRDDSEVLPSVVGQLLFPSGLIVRAGFAKVLSFPSTSSLNNGVSLNNDPVFVNGVQTQLGTGSGGSPDLDPFKAKQYDLSFEYYFGGEGLISLGAFYKDVNSFVVSIKAPETYNNTVYTISRQTNGRNGTVKGLELLYQQPFTFLPAPLDGLGAMVTYSYIASETPIKDAQGRTMTFPGLSKNNVNLVGYYEKGPIGLRVAYNWRDKYFNSLNGTTGNGVFTNSYKDLSATAKYKLYRGVEVKLEGINLLNSKQRSYDGYSEGLVTNVIYGRIYKLGVSMTF